MEYADEGFLFAILSPPSKKKNDRKEFVSLRVFIRNINPEIFEHNSIVIIRGKSKIELTAVVIERD